MKTIKNKLFVLNYVGSLLLILATFVPIIKFNNLSFAFVDQFFYLSLAIVILSTIILILTTAKKYKLSLIPTILCAGIIIYGIYSILNIEGLKSMQNISYGIAFILYPLGFIINLVGGIFAKNINETTSIKNDEISAKEVKDNLISNIDNNPDFENLEQIPLDKIVNNGTNIDFIELENNSLNNSVNNDYNISENIQINFDSTNDNNMNKNDIINEIKTDEIVLEENIEFIPEIQISENNDGVNNSSNYIEDNKKNDLQMNDINEINFKETMDIIDEIENSETNNNNNIFNFNSDTLESNNDLMVDTKSDEAIANNLDLNYITEDIVESVESDNPSINIFNQSNEKINDAEFNISDGNVQNNDEIKNIQITSIDELEDFCTDETIDNNEIIMTDITNEIVDDNNIIKNYNLEIPDLDIENSIMTNNTQIEEKVEQNFMAINPSDIKVDEKKVLFKKKEKKEEDPLQKIMNRDIPRTLDRTCQFCSSPLGDDERICPLCGRIN